MLEDQIFCKLLVRFLNLVINSDSDVHWLQREDGVHSRLKNCHWIGMVAGGLLLGCVGRGLDRQSKRNGRDTIQNWSTVINIWQNDGQKKKMQKPAGLFSLLSELQDKQQVLQQTQQTGQQNCAEMCQGSTCCAPSLRSPWWDAKAATWVD